MPDPKLLLDDDERRLLALAYGAGLVHDGRAPEDAEIAEVEMAKIIEWAEQCRLSNGILLNVLAGNLMLSVTNGEVCFQLTELGEKRGASYAQEFEGDG